MQFITKNKRENKKMRGICESENSEQTKKPVKKGTCPDY